MLADPARSKDSGGSHVAARLQWTQSCRLSGNAQESKKSFLSRTARSSTARAGETPDVRFRIDDCLRNRLTRQREQDAAQGPRLFAGRVAGWSGDSDFASRNDNPPPLPRTMTPQH